MKTREFTVTSVRVGQSDGEAAGNGMERPE